MLSQTGVYAVQALLHLAAQPNGRHVPAGSVARDLGIPATYLAKVLQRLARHGILESTRGARGGYRLSGNPTEITVAAVVAPFEGMAGRETCLLGGPCDPARPCSAHARRAAWNAAALKILQQTTLADLLTGAPLGALGPASPAPPEDPR